MTEVEKQRFYEEAQANVTATVSRLAKAQQERQEKVQELRQKIRAGHSPDRLVELKLLALYEGQTEDLAHLRSAPFVSVCKVMNEQGESEVLRFAKAAFPEERIYSWVAPAAQLRFSTCGRTSYRRPDGTDARVRLTEKDQYLIHEGKILFLATEAIDQARELVYQAYFSQHKSQFALADIVAQMEAAQDRVIRAPVEGSMLITGPAGSGKTTLALHRVAYLAQAPETAERFPGKRISVFVQDRSSQEYFSHLLPELGIHDVAITTFEAWARALLGCESVEYVDRFGETDEEADRYEWQKAQSLHQESSIPAMIDPWDQLERWYWEVASQEVQLRFREQRKAAVLDRIDLTVLLQLRVAREGALLQDVTYYEERSNGKLKKVQTREPLRYALLILDEVQNYLPAQIRLLRSCVDPATRALLYVGDLAQQTRLATLRDWNAVGEVELAAQTVRLEKTYRSTREILEFLAQEGYTVQIRDDLRHGPEVVVRTLESVELADWVQEICAQHPSVSIGCLAHSSRVLQESGLCTLATERLRVLTIREAQGVEFDVVFFVDLPEPTVRTEEDPGFQEERQRVWRDLRYVGLTRAMNALYVAKIAS